MILIAKRTTDRCNVDTFDHVPYKQSLRWGFLQTDLLREGSQEKTMKRGNQNVAGNM